ncbi:DUF4280 domain-containing protein [Lachnoanaerobaculum sp. Marseille-Q4761]|uniref:DUF4280 domain-containing protein n=1 Tax=Lachnoanaerobaculum sp. Marseille-Q4761 TaxID=2819511 RepID=UPI001FB6DA35|nr:DUF4280 domain-containing protein [Lachnoanaerobaculum sp. Marseille-Q4761]
MKGYGGYEYVVRGAEVSCSYGSKTCVLNLKDDHGAHTSDGRPLITENDSTTDNIKSFGMCNKNRSKPCKCDPKLGKWWATDNSNMKIFDTAVGEESYAVMEDSLATCNKGGLVSFKTSGQTSPSYDNVKVKYAVEIVEDEKKNWSRKSDKKDFVGHVKVKNSGLYNFGIEFYDIKSDDSLGTIFVYEKSWGKMKYIGAYEIKSHAGNKEMKFPDDVRKINENTYGYVSGSHYWSHWIDIILYGGKDYYFEVDCPGRDGFACKLIGNQEIFIDKNIMMAVWRESDICTSWYKKNTGGVVLKRAVVYLRKPYIEPFYNYFAGIYLGHEIKNDDRDTAISTSKTVVETGIGIFDTFAGVCITALDLTFGWIGISEIKELTTQLKPYINNNNVVDMIKITMYGNPDGLVKEYDMDAEVSTEVSEYGTPNRLEGEKYHWGNFEGIYYSQDEKFINMGEMNKFIEHEIIGKMNN